MEVNLEQLKKNFIVIKDIRNKVTNLFQILGDHLIKLKQTYSEFVKMNKDNLFIFGLDSFQFQSKLIDIEFNDMKRLFLAINNRMYCEYYKLYKIIADFIKDNINDRKSLDIVKLVNSFPVYKDLEPFKQYNFDTIQEIHDNIILLLYGINEFILNKENELQCHQKKQSIGLNINNFVNTFNYNILIVKEKGTLFISYIEFFHSLHTKHLQRFAMKMNLMYTQLTHDIRFEDNGESAEEKKKDLINKYQDDNIDKDLLNQIKLSVDDNISNYSQDSSEISYLNSPIHSLQSKSGEFEEGKTNKFNLNLSKQISSEEIELNPVKKKSMSSILKKNVKKVVNSLGIFKNTQNKDEKPTLTSENLLNQNKSNKMAININMINNEDKISNKSSISDNSLNKYSNESDKIDKTKSMDEIFLELSNQCDEIINSNGKNCNLKSNSEDSFTSFSDNVPAVYINVNDQSDELQNHDEVEIENKESDKNKESELENKETDEFKESDENKESDEFKESDENKESDEYKESDEFKESDENKESDEYKETDENENKESDEYKETDENENKESDEFKESDENKDQDEIDSEPIISDTLETEANFETIVNKKKKKKSKPKKK